MQVAEEEGSKNKNKLQDLIAAWSVIRLIKGGKWVTFIARTGMEGLYVLMMI